jgi:membrane protease YdiL (CAAX protease family)
VLMPKTDRPSLKVFYYFIYLLVVWGFFRLLFRLPEVIEEFWIKPIIWLTPLFGLWINEKERVKFFKGSWIKALMWGGGLGLLWLVIAVVVSLGRSGNAVFFPGDISKYGDVLGAALATAIVEELVFSGFIFQKLHKKARDPRHAILMTAGMFSLIHLPIGLFVYKYSSVQLIEFLLVVALVEMGSSFVMNKSNNVMAPILSHFMWAVAMTIV